jgi:hypothetical protein
MSLKEKAKRVDEWYNELMPIEGSDSEGNFRRSSNVLLVRLEDAQKEIDKLTEQRSIESKIVDRMLKEKEEMKQKLQQLLAEFPKKRWDEIFEWRDYDDEEIDEWKKKFEELLKEEKEAKA